MDEMPLFPQSAVERRIKQLPPAQQPTARTLYKRAVTAAELEGLPFLVGLVLLIGGLRGASALNAHWSAAPIIVVLSIGAGFAVHRCFSQRASAMLVKSVQHEINRSPVQRDNMVNAAIDDDRIRPVVRQALRREE